MKKTILKELEWSVGLVALALSALSVLLAKFEMKEIGFWLFVASLAVFLISLFLFYAKAKNQ